MLKTRELRGTAAPRKEALAVAVDHRRRLPSSRVLDGRHADAARDHVLRRAHPRAVPGDVLDDLLGHSGALRHGLEDARHLARVEAIAHHAPAQRAEEPALAHPASLELTDATFTLVDARGRKYLKLADRKRFLAAARAHPKRPPHSRSSAFVSAVCASSRLLEGSRRPRTSCKFLRCCRKFRQISPILGI